MCVLVLYTSQISWSTDLSALSQCRRNESQPGASDEDYAIEGGNGEVEEGEDEDEDMLPAQR